MAALTSHRAFTLLETLLAMTVIASMSLLIAQAYRVAHDAADGGAHLERAMTVQRVLRLMEDQWGDRRTLVLESDNAAVMPPETNSVVFAPDRVRFVTGAAALHPDSPLVEASYIIERQGNSFATSPAWNLIYQEEPITSFRMDRTMPARAARITLLEDCAALRVERFAEQALEPDQETALQWAPYVQADVDNDEDVEPEMPIAVRIVGEYQGEQVTCVFVARALR